VAGHVETVTAILTSARAPHLISHEPAQALGPLYLLLTSGYAEELVHAEDWERERLRVLRKPYHQADPERSVMSLGLFHYTLATSQAERATICLYPHQPRR
jgi:hypothetical protein